MDSPPPKTSPNRAATFPPYRRISQYAVPHFDANKLYREQMCLVRDRVYWFQARFSRAAHVDKGRAKDGLGGFWNAPATACEPGLKAADLFEAVHDGWIKALWVMATNPAVSMPNATRVREALDRCPFVVVSDVIADTDTGRFAHVRLPALGWGEKGGTVTNCDLTNSRQRAFLPPPGKARPDWWIVAEVAKRMGFATSFTYSGPAAIFCEHAVRTSALDPPRPARTCHGRAGGG